jgi:hypothetical protein
LLDLVLGRYLAFIALNEWTDWKNDNIILLLALGKLGCSANLDI